MIRLLVFLFLLASPATSESIVVRSGAHPGFTRLVLDVSPMPSWTAGRTSSGYSVQLPVGTTFDTSRVFRLIDRSRVRALQDRGDGRLDIDLACTCWARLYSLGGRAIVIDVRNGTAGRTAKFEAAFSDTAELLPVANLEFTSAPQDGASPLGPAPIADPGPLSIVPPAIVPPPRRPASPAPMLPSPQNVLPFMIGEAHAQVKSNSVQFGVSAGTIVDLSQRSRASVEAFQPEIQIPTLRERSTAVDLLSRELARAAAQGLVNAESPSQRARTLTGSGGGALNQRSNITITTSIDQAITPSRPNLPPTANGTVCLPDEMFDVAAWGDPTDPLTLGKKRTKAYDESGFISTKGALDLARFYIASGFGGEARTVLSAVSYKPEHEVVLALAEIVDYTESRATILDGQAACPGKVALWATLAKPLTLAETPSDPNYILRAFAALPRHLRQHLGPTLAQRLQGVGLDSEARNALNAATRAGGTTSAHALSSARLGLTGTTAETARRSLLNLSRGADTVAAEALLELFEDAERRGVVPDVEWVEDAPSLVRATIGTELSARLNLAGLRGRISNGQYDRLRAALNSDSAGVTSQVAVDLSARALAHAAENASDADFLKTELGLSKLAGPNAVEREGRTAVAKRLLSLGLAQRAARYLPTDPESLDERELAARILAANGNGAEAVRVLEAANKSAELQGVLGEVLEGDGRLAESIAAYNQAEAQEAATRNAFRIADWDWVADNARDDLAEAASALIGARDVESNGALLTGSEVLRQRAQRLLNEVAVGDS